MQVYYFKEKFFKITDHYPVLDQDGNEAYFIDQDFKFIGFKVKIKNLATGETILVEQKVFNLLPTYEVRFEDGSVMYVKAKIALLGRKVDASYEGDVLKLKGNIWDFSFDVYKDRKLIGSLDKKILSFTDQYALRVEDENYADLLIALTICINNIKDRAKANNNANANN